MPGSPVSPARSLRTVLATLICIPQTGLVTLRTAVRYIAAAQMSRLRMFSATLSLRCMLPRMSRGSPCSGQGQPDAAEHGVDDESGDRHRHERQRGDPRCRLGGVVLAVGDDD